MWTERLPTSRTQWTFSEREATAQVAWTCRDYANTLLERNDRGDRAMATSLVDGSLAIQRTGHAAVDGAGAVKSLGIG